MLACPKCIRVISMFACHKNKSLCLYSNVECGVQIVLLKMYSVLKIVENRRVLQ